MHTAEKKWQANREKVSYARTFPGLLDGAPATIGKTVARLVILDGTPAVEIMLFTDNSFLVRSGAGTPDPAEILRAIAALRESLYPVYSEAYDTLEALAEEDRELTRRARLENILGAIRGNIARIPELHQEIPRLLAEIRDSEPNSDETGKPLPG